MINITLSSLFSLELKLRGLFVIHTHCFCFVVATGGLLWLALACSGFPSTAEEMYVGREGHDVLHTRTVDATWDAPTLRVMGQAYNNSMYCK